jgi:hypothetical protein
MIIELFGLSKTGKTITANSLRTQERYVFDFKKTTTLKKLSLFTNYTLRNPLTTIKLFHLLNKNHISTNYKVWLMRNSYLASVLAKYNLIKNKENQIFIEEFSLQSLFMILQKKSNKTEISKAINLLPKSNSLLLFERSREQRHKIYKKPHPTFRINPTMYPGGWINVEYAKQWMENMEHNYEIIKEIIQENYQEDKLIFKELNLDLPKVYSSKQQSL